MGGLGLGFSLSSAEKSPGNEVELPSDFRCILRKGAEKVVRNRVFDFCCVI